jgi:hypothetical protein
MADESYTGTYAAATLDDLDREAEHQVLEALADNQQAWGVWDGTAATFAPPPPRWDR